MAGEITQPDFSSDLFTVKKKKKKNLTKNPLCIYPGSCKGLSQGIGHWPAILSSTSKTELFANGSDAPHHRAEWEAGLGGCSAVGRRVTEGLQMGFLQQEQPTGLRSIWAGPAADWMAVTGGMVAVVPFLSF